MRLEASYCGVLGLCGGEEFRAIDTVIKRQALQKSGEVAAASLRETFFIAASSIVWYIFIGVSAFLQVDCPLGRGFGVLTSAWGGAQNVGKPGVFRGKIIFGGSKA